MPLPTYAELAARLGELRRPPTAREERDLRRAWARATPEERARAVAGTLDEFAAWRRERVMQDLDAALLKRAAEREAAPAVAATSAFGRPS